MSAKVGLDCLLQVMSAGTFDSPTFIDVPRVGDVSVPSDVTAVEGSTRASNVKTYEAGMTELGCSFKLLSDANDPAFIIIRDAHRARGEDAKILVNIVDGASDDETAEALKMWMIVTKFGQEQPLDGRVARDVELKPAEKDGDVYEYTDGVAAS